MFVFHVSIFIQEHDVVISQVKGSEMPQLTLLYVCSFLPISAIPVDIRLDMVYLLGKVHVCMCVCVCGCACLCVHVLLCY